MPEISRYGKNSSRIVSLICSFLLSILCAGCGNIEGLVDIEAEDYPVISSCTPIVALSGSKSIQFSIERFVDKSFLARTASDSVDVYLDYAGQLLALESVNSFPWVYRYSGIIRTPGCGDIVIFKDNEEILRFQKIFKVIDNFKITLTFDDGPGLDKKSKQNNISTSPTVITLDALDNFVHGKNGSKKGIKAAFFVLSTSDRFLHIVYNKANTAQGKAVLQEVAERGNVIGVHSGGEYKTQFHSHDKRVLEPPYSVCEQPSENFENALEADLYECIATIEKITGEVPEFVRPPLWRYESNSNKAVGEMVKKAYCKYGLKMILTDAKFPDGGYYLISIVAIPKYKEFRKNLRRAFLSGEDNIILSMHDSNRYTANILNNILKMVVKEFGQIKFSGYKASAGDRLDFADTYNEVRDNLLTKTRFVMFPEYNRNSKNME